MATYNNGRRAPNVSQYIANLNTIPTQQDIAAQNDFDIANDNLDFLNTEFFDFDASTFDPSSFSRQQPSAIAGETFQFPELQQFPPPSFSQSPASISQDASAIPFPAQAIDAGVKRTAAVAQLQPVADLEDSSRAAAEEDKRRRNTAASARFRVKKKQREAALEKQAKDMTDKVHALESKVQQLEMENKWLKGLITEKSDKKGIEEKFQKFVKDKTANKVETSTDERNDGVGTEA